MAGTGSLGEGEGGAEQPVELNLTAFMDILSNLLFFLLASFGVAVIAAVSASVPVTSTEEGDLAKSDDAVTMTVAIGRDGFRLSAASDTLPPERLQTLAASLARTNRPPAEPIPGSSLNALDFTSLTDLLFRVKETYPKSETVILVPEPAIKYAEVVQTMDAARDRLEKDDQGVAGKKRGFGKVVVSTLIQ